MCLQWGGGGGGLLGVGQHPSFLQKGGTVSHWFKHRKPDVRKRQKIPILPKVATSYFKKKTSLAANLATLTLEPTDELFSNADDRAYCNLLSVSFFLSAAEHHD